MLPFLKYEYIQGGYISSNGFFFFSLSVKLAKFFPKKIPNSTFLIAVQKKMVVVGSEL